MSTGGGNQTTTTKSDPPAFLTPYLGSAAQMAADEYGNNPLTPYQGQRTVGQSGLTQQAIDLTGQRALAGSTGVDAGQNFIEAGLSRPATASYGGAGENPYAMQPNMFGAANNPYLDATFNKAALATQNQLASEFARSGRNVGASQGLRAQQLGDLATGIYGGAYDAERNRQLQYQQQLTGIGASGIENERNRLMQSGENAADRQQSLLGYAIPYANQDYNDLQQLASAGRATDQYGQQQLNDQRDLYNETQAASGQRVDDYIRRLTGFMGAGGTTTQSTPTYRNPLGGAIGGAMAGSALGPWGALGGGLLGGIFG